MTNLSARQEKFAQLYTQGMAAGRAYEQAGYSTTGNTSDVKGSQLVRNGKVAARIKELQAKNEARGQMSKDEAMEFLAGVIRAKAAEIDGHSIYCAEDYDTQFGRRVKGWNKIAALQQLGRMCGWESEIKVSMSKFEDIVAKVVDR